MNPFNWAEGYRSYILGASTILGGLLLILDGKMTEGFAAITAGIGIITAKEAARRVEAKL